MNRALLVGINAYPGAPLNGCVNDVTDMASFLVKPCGFAMGDIRLVTDSRATKTAIVDRLGWLLTGLQKGDRILFH
ncbi:MAG TPA: caspase family protein, partial [Chloroflexota bacterium]